MFKARVKITENKTSGWDSWMECSLIDLKSPTLQGLRTKIKELEQDEHIGDFGIPLHSRTVYVIKSWEVIQKEKIKMVKL